ncbi:ABC transporter ATP-binding protein [Planococcus sp. YIM B11945]|uniref:ABC transporter ATP-binding protein n=1 Tax=Planococcus sp. YIM B11945 TaxID=3435410 RepID=UPI003D7EF31A
MKTILNATNLTKVYGKKGRGLYTAVDNVSFSMKEGEFIGIMGPSGSGKTTLLNLVSTLDSITEGKILIDETPLSTMDQDELSDFRSQKLGFVFQDFNLLENMSVFENIALPLSLRKTPIKAIETMVHQLARVLGIESILEKYPAEISGGQKQRTAIARALIHKPALILADEPTGALDSKNAATLMATLADLNKKQTASILMVTHDAQSASYCSRLLFIKDGKIDQELHSRGTREQFYNDILSVLSAMDRRPAAGGVR